MQCNMCGATLPAGAVTCPSCGANAPSYISGSTPYTLPSGSGPYPNYGSFQEAGAAPDPASQPPASNPYLYSGQAYTVPPPTPTPPAPYSNQPYTPMAPPTQSFPTQQPPQRRARGAAPLIFLLALLLIAAGALVYYTTVSTPAQLNAQATAIAQKFSNNETRTASTTPQGLYDSTTKSRPQLNDPLNNGSNSTWLTQTTSDHGCNFNNGAYHVTEATNGHFYYCTGGNRCNNCLFQIQMTIVSGDAGGIMLRVNRDTSQFYRFGVYTDGSYRLYKYVDNTGTNAQMLLGGSSPIIPTTPNQPILIAAVANGNNLYMYVNKHYIGNASDSSFSNGEPGLFATDLTAPANVAFSNAQEWNL
ncbi:MAG: zinc ribbon domain-containing protein [Chloroflexota bacterium]|nr:zinc ribbon domain-containing protein [Chloroflexota bacterium]